MRCGRPARTDGRPGGECACAGQDASSSSRFPHGSSTKKRVTPGVSDGSAQRTSTSWASNQPASSPSSATGLTRSAGCAFVAGAKGSATPTWSSCGPTRNQTPPRAASVAASRSPPGRGAAVEAPGLVFAAGWSGDLDVVERDDPTAHGARLDAPRDPGPEKRTRFSRWVPCRTPVTPSSGPGLPSCDCWFTLRARGHAQRRADRSVLRHWARRTATRPPACRRAQRAAPAPV